MKRFDYKSIIGHSLICEKLRQAVKTGRSVSAYLLSGAPGIGKKTVCRAFAAALLCENPLDGAACGVCESCRLLAADAHPDYIRLQLTEDKKTIGVEQVREVLIKEASIRPFTAKRKVFVVEHAEAMTVQAQNALLKVLEEPPAYAVFILLAESKEKLLDTVLSRTLKLQLLPLSAPLCEEYFNNRGEDDSSRAMFAARFCQGILGRGEKILTDEAYYELYKNSVHELFGMLKSPATLTDAQRFLTEQKDNIFDVIDFWLLFLRDCLRYNISGEGKMICIDQKTAICSFTKAASPAALVHVMEAVIKYRERLQKNANFTAASLALLTKIQEEIHDKGSRNPF